MTYGELSVILSCFVAQRSATTITHLRPYYGPIEKLLAANVVADIIGATVRDHLPSVRPVYGLDRWLFHLGQACYLVWPVGCAAVFLAVLARWKTWPAFAVGTVLLAVRVIGYSITAANGLPVIRGDNLAWLILLEQIALVILAVVAWASFYRHARPRNFEHPWWQEHHIAAAAIGVLEIAQIAGPHMISVTNGSGLHLHPPDPYQKWPLAQIGYTSLFLFLTVMQRRWQRWRPVIS